MIEHGIHEQDYLGICKNYRCVYYTNTIQEDKVAKEHLVRDQQLLFLVIQTLFSEDNVGF
jgi:hypothetical protein